MKILAFNGSPRLKGNTATMLDSAISGACENGAEEAKKAYRDAHFSNDCLNARLLGEQLAYQEKIK